MPARALLWQGMLAGCVFWIKFTICGVQAGLFLALLIHPAARRDWRGLWRSLGWLIAGFALSTLPWVVYFGANGAIADWLGTYLHDNLFCTSASGEAAALGSGPRPCCNAAGNGCGTIRPARCPSPAA